MSWVAVAAAGAAVVGGGLSYLGNREAGQAAARGSQAAVDEQRRQFNTLLGLQAPFQATGVGANNALARLFGLPFQSGGTSGTSPSGPSPSIVSGPSSNSSRAINALHGSSIGNLLLGPPGIALGAVVGGDVFGDRTSGAERTWDAYKRNAGTGALLGADPAAVGEIVKGLFDTNNAALAGVGSKEQFVAKLGEALNAARQSGQLTQQSTPQEIGNFIKTWVASSGGNPNANQNPILWNALGDVGQRLLSGADTFTNSAGAGLTNIGGFPQSAQEQGTAGPDMSVFFESPGYQFRRGEGTRDIQNVFAARGAGQSGNALRALSEFNQNLASNEFGNFVDTLMGISGRGQQGAQFAGNAAVTTGANVGNALMNMGNARASGIAGGYQGINDAIQGGVSNWLLSRYLRGNG